MKFGVFFTCYNEVDAVTYSLEKLYEVYPSVRVYLVSEGEDFSFLKKRFSNLSTNLVDDTMSATFDITDTNFRSEVHQNNIKLSILELIDRLNKAIEFCNNDYILMMDPDALVRGKLTIPTNATLLGSRINVGFPNELRNVIKSIEGSIDINCWGATPAIFKVSSYKSAIDIFFKNTLMNDLCMSFYAMYAHDVLLPVLFSLIGEEETFNPDIVECKRNPSWESTNQPLVHQFRKYYTK